MTMTPSQPQPEDIAARPHRLSDVFQCDYRGRRLYLAQCLDEYMNATALRNRSTICHDCPQGAVNRESFAADADTEGLLDGELWGQLLGDIPEER